MKNHKKVLCAIISLMILVSMLAACAAPQQSAAPSGSEDTQEATTASAAGGESSGGEISTDPSNTIAYCSLYNGSYFFYVMYDAIEKAVTDAGYNFVSVDCNIDATVQAEQFSNYIAQGVKAIIADASDSDGISELVKQANDAGIPVAFVDTIATGGEVAVSVAFDNYEAGKIAGEKAVELLTERYGEAKGSVLDVYGRLSSEASRGRMDGFEDIIKQYPDITLYSIEANDEQVGYDAISNTLAQDPDLDLVYLYTESWYDSAVEALKANNVWYPADDENHVFMMSIDATPIALDYIRSGYADVAIAQDAYAYATIATDMLFDYIFKGEEVPLGTFEDDTYYWESCEVVEGATGPRVNVPAYAVTAENVDDERHWANIGAKVLGTEDR